MCAPWTFNNVWTNFQLSQLGMGDASGIWRVEGKMLQTSSQAPQAKKDLASNVHSSGVGGALPESNEEKVLTSEAQVVRLLLLPPNTVPPLYHSKNHFTKTMTSLRCTIRNFKTSVDPCKQHHNQDSEQFYHPNSSLVQSGVVTASPSPNPWHQEPTLHGSGRMSYKWNHSV